MDIESPTVVWCVTNELPETSDGTIGFQEGMDILGGTFNIVPLSKMAIGFGVYAKSGLFGMPSTLDQIAAPHLGLWHT